MLTRRFHTGRYPALARQVLVVLQFTVSLTLIIGTIVVYTQIQFAKDRPVGYSREGLIAIDMNTPWLQGYQYRAALSGWIFVAAGIGIIMITLLTVSYQSLKAALMNPVRSLRTE